MTLGCLGLSELPVTLMAMTTSHDHDWPAPTVIGQVSSGDLAFLPEACAVEVAAELDRWRAATTWGQARSLAGQAEHVAPPFAVEDLEDAEDGDATFAVAELGRVADGDWPPSLAALSLALVQRHWSGRGSFAVGTIVDTVLNGPALEIGPAEEQPLRRALEAAGCTVRRDDDLVRRAGEV